VLRQTNKAADRRAAEDRQNERERDFRLFQRDTARRGHQIRKEPPMTPSRTRKNIDTLTAQEVADYEHGFAKLKEISDANADSFDGLTYFQNLHNSMLGPCEHANDTFLPWHRAHLFLSEEALSAAARHFCGRSSSAP
jgi:hypothetical protein